MGNFWVVPIYSRVKVKAVCATFSCSDAVHCSKVTPNYTEANTAVKTKPKLCTWWRQKKKNGVAAPLIRNICTGWDVCGELHVLAALFLVKNVITRWVGESVGSRTRLDVSEKTWIFTPPPRHSPRMEARLLRCTSLKLGSIDYANPIPHYSREVKKHVHT
jgi:hypothetical protein